MPETPGVQVVGAENFLVKTAPFGKKATKKIEFVQGYAGAQPGEVTIMENMETKAGADGKPTKFAFGPSFQSADAAKAWLKEQGYQPVES